MAVLHIRLLGNCHLSYGDTPVTGVNTPRLQSLLAYLLLHPQAPQSRHYAACLLWPDSTEVQALTNLRQILHHLRRALPEVGAYLQIETKTLQWRPDAGYTCDVADFEHDLTQAAAAVKQGHSVEREALENAVHHYHGDLLPNCYDEWILPIRERLSQAFLGALERLIQLGEAQRDYRSAIAHAERLLRYDPLHETTYRRLMRLHALQGDRASALRVYHNCVTLLGRELGVEPNTDTQEAYHRLLNMEAPAVLQTQPSMSAALPSLVGRQDEWNSLRSAWRSAAAGNSVLVLISGEAGIGKTRLAEGFLEWAAQQGITTASTRAYAAEGQLAYAPVIELLRTAPLNTRLSRLEDVWLQELSRLMPELLTARPSLPGPEAIGTSWQRQRLFEALARALHNDKEPLLLLFDDMQWCDQDTLEWLHYLLHFEGKARLLVLATMRPEEVDQSHPLTLMLLDLRLREQATEIELGPLNELDTAALAEQVAGRKLGADEAAQLFPFTEGNPLFVVETVRAVENGGETDRAFVLRSATAFEQLPFPTKIPSKIQAVIQARLRQISPSARKLADLAATIGRAFTADVLATASGGGEDDFVQRQDELWRRRILCERGEDAYNFSHDRIRDVIYAEMSQARRRFCHRRVAVALEVVHAGALESVSGQIAYHYEHAGLPVQAVPFHQLAAKVTQRVYAHADAADHLARGLALLERLPVTTERLQQALALQLTLGVSLTVLKGVSALPTKEVYVRSQTLAAQVGDDSQRLTVLDGLYSSFITQGHVDTARDIAAQALALAEKARDPFWLEASYGMLGVAMLHLGQWTAARDNLAQHAIGHTDDSWSDPESLLPAQHFGATHQRHLALVLWHLGYADQALKQMEDTLALVRSLSHPYSLAATLSWSAWLHHYRREPALAQAQAEQAIALSQQYGFAYWLAHSQVIEGWAMAQQGQVEAGIARMQEGLAARLPMNAYLHQPAFLAMLAETCGEAGQPERGLQLLGEALEQVETTGERCSQAELHRLRGELLLMQATEEQVVESCFLQALGVARQQEARALELRAAVSLSRLWQTQGKKEAARDLLAGVYDWFCEGLDTGDLCQARVLLD